MEVIMNKLFEPSSIKSMHLNNRFVRSATWEGLADNDGFVTPGLTKMMVELAEGEVGLIISGYTFVSPEGKSSPGQLAVWNDHFLPGLKDMVKAVHDAGGRIALQLVHGGCFSDPVLTGMKAVGPSDNEKGGQPPCHAAGRKDIEGMVFAFTHGAARAIKAGFDAIQIHAAHGFLLSQFLSPAFNRRNDEYGGSLENRARILLEVVENTRKEVGPDYPILVKLNSEDFLENGMGREEAVRVSAMLEQSSIDAIEYSGGTVASAEFMAPRPGMLKTPEEEVYYRAAARQYKQNVAIPLMLVGGIRSYTVAEELVQSGTADYIALSRPFICEPHLVKRWREGDHRRAECVSDNACFAPTAEGKGICCVTMQKKRRTAGI